MGWNEPEKGKDPWSGKTKPPDLDEALKRLLDKLKKLLSNGSNGAKRNAGGPPKVAQNARFLLAIFFSIIALFWILSGIFIVDPAEQAVVLRFGKYLKTVGPGPHWIANFIESKEVINVERVLHYSYSAQMLTKDENLVAVSVAVQYRIGDLKAYLFNVASPEESLKQATSSALRQVVGMTTLDEIITEGREAWGIHVLDSLIKILGAYNTGIVVVHVAPQPARAPEEVQDAFDDAIKAREDEKRFEYQAQGYEAKVLPIAQGNAKRITEEAKAYAEQVVLRAKGEVAEFLALLPSFTTSPMVTSTRLYLASMQEILSRTTKVVVNGQGNMLYLPLEQLAKTWPVMPKEKENMSPLPEVARITGSSLLRREESQRETVRQGRMN